MAFINKVILIGNLGKDPEVRTFPNGGKIATVRIATTEYWTDKQSGEKRELTEWHTITFSDRLADVVERYLRKGSSIYIEGKLRTRSWDDKQTGQKRYATEVRADVMQMLGGKPDAQRSSGNYDQQGGAQYGGQDGYGSSQPNEYARQSAGYGNRNGGYQKPQAAPAQRPAAQPARSAEPVPAGAFDDFRDDDIPF